MSDHRWSPARIREFALAERARIRATLADLSPEQWQTPSLCEEWTVKEVAGHLAENARGGLAGFLTGMARCGFDHDRFNTRSARRWAALPEQDLLRALDTERIMLVFRLKPTLLLVDSVVHHQDIRRPLGLAPAFPEEHLAAALDAVRTDGMFAAERKRFDGLRLIATDIDWSHGTGPAAMKGSAEALIMTLMGRASAEEEVSAETDVR